MPIFLKQSLIWLKQALAWSAGISALVIPPSLLTIYYTEPTRLSFLDSKSSESVAQHRPAAEIPFDLTAAVDACKVESQERLSDVLLRSSVDWHSTRYQPNRGIYVVILKADIGSLRNFEEANVYCYVSPRTEKVSYFNAYDANGKSYVSRAISFNTVVKAFSNY
ncbi:hypothetical protein [Candidatus Pelagadaptatus aseana]|uniref:hypothetical protein n=1 Tax=Candidatus Pelagadaptatus aseana TaxID=3120508 RepID=UPI003C6FEE6A